MKSARPPLPRRRRTNGNINLLLVLVAVLALGAAGVFWLNSIGFVWPIGTKVYGPSSGPTTSKPAMGDNWEVYTNDRLGFSIEYPIMSNPYVYEKYNKGIYRQGKGFEGESFYANLDLGQKDVFTPPGTSIIEIGGITWSYYDTVAYDFLSTNGYYKEDGGKVYFLDNISNENKVDISENIVDIFQNQNGVEIVLVKGKSQELPHDTGYTTVGVRGFPYIDQLGALVNLPKKTNGYTGIALLTSLSGTGEKTFREILSTLEFTE